MDPKVIREHYASLTDEELRVVDRTDLTPTAQKIFDSEVQRRGLSLDSREGEVETVVQTAKPELDADWLENASAVTTFSGGASAAAEAVEARDALLAAGIPCEITEHDIDETEIESADELVPATYRIYRATVPGAGDVPMRSLEYRVMVPAAFSLQAASVLDIAIFNPRLEEDWKTQFEGLSDEELRALSVDALCAGLLDRVVRLRKVYNTEVARRCGET
jgi:hypothetical protein